MASRATQRIILEHKRRAGSDHYLLTILESIGRIVDASQLGVVIPFRFFEW